MACTIPAVIIHALRTPEPTPGDFNPTQFTPAASKAWFVTHFLRFASADFPKHHFTECFYGRVMNTFGFVAHYDRAGFWREYFTNTAGKIEFIEQVIQWPCPGDPARTFSDAEQAIIRRISQADLLGCYYQIDRTERLADERTGFARLKGHLEPVYTPLSPPSPRLALPVCRGRTSRAPAISGQLALPIG